MSTICDDLRAAILQAAMQGKITDSKIDDNTLRPLWSVTYWDKKFKEVSREKQPRTISYHHVLANFFKDVEDEDGDVFLLSTGSYEGYTTEEKAGEHLCEGEVVTIPWGGKPTIKYYKGKFVTSDNRIATSRDTKILDNRFLYYFMLSRYDYINDSYRGAALKHPEMKLILDMEIPVFPINEQMLIVQKLDELMPRIADLEQSADALASLKKAFPDDIKASLLQAAMQGKLTKQLPEDGDAERLYNQIELEKHAITKNGKAIRWDSQPKLEENEQPYRIPNTWKWVRLGDIIHIESGNGLTSNQMKPGKIPVYGGNGITGYHGESFLHKETVVIGRVGFYCGSVHVTQKESWVTDNAFITTYPENSIDREFLVYALRFMNLGQNNNATAQPVVSGKKIYPLPFPLPPLAEQKRIVERLDILMKNINAVGELIASE